MAAVRFRVTKIEADFHLLPSIRDFRAYSWVCNRTVTLKPILDDKTTWQGVLGSEITFTSSNPEAWKELELGQEYLMDFVPAQDWLGGSVSPANLTGLALAVDHSPYEGKAPQ